MTDKITKVEEMNFLPITQGLDKTQALIKANLGSEELGMFDLERAVNPSGKSTTWEIPGLEEEPEIVKELTGVVVFHKLVRTYWIDEYKGGGKPPACSSKDGFHGEGDPGGECSDCPFAIFGSGPNNSQACKLIKQIYLLREGELLPMVINLSPINVGVAKTYFVRLLSKRQLAFNHVVTKIKLESAVSNSGFDYAKAVMTLQSPLPLEMRDEMERFTEILTPHLSDLELADTVDDLDAVQAPEF